MTCPTDPVVVPAVVVDIAAGRSTRAVWRNELGGVTFRIADAGGSEYVKTGPDDFAAERARLAWARRFIPVPQVLGSGPGWLHTVGLPGFSAVDPRWAKDPAVAARAVGVGLRVMHARLPVQNCPFDWSAPSRLARIVASERAALATPPSVDKLVVCHGDACTPNTLMDAAGNYCGHVDLGSLGVADRWADLAVATMALDWNFERRDGRDWQDELLAAYGVAADPVRIAYYRRLWDAPEVDDV